MTKLGLFELTQYDKMLGLDTDMLVTRQLDEVFHDAGTRVRQIEPLDEVERIKLKPSEPLPSVGAEYLIAGQPQQASFDKPYPPDPNNAWLCLGFFVFKPLQAIFDYYMSLKEVEERFETVFPDQKMLTYAHRWDGPMPWIHVDYRWTSTFANFDDYTMGAATFHAKYWIEDFGQGRKLGTNRLHTMW